MVISQLKNQNFFSGFIIGFLLTFGRVWFAILELIFRPIFDFWSFWPIGVIYEIIPIFISGLVMFLILRLLFLKKDGSLLGSIKFFSFGFFSSYALFLLLTILAISQFKFTQ
jgi:hypothetical protein